MNWDDDDGGGGSGGGGGGGSDWDDVDGDGSGGGDGDDNFIIFRDKIKAYCKTRTGLDWTCKTRTQKFVKRGPKICKTRTQNL